MDNNIKQKIERRIAQWLNGNGIDTELNRADFKMAQEIMRLKLKWTMDGVLYSLPSINDLLDGKPIKDVEDELTIKELAKY
jgi:hypothetical protein